MSLHTLFEVQIIKVQYNLKFWWRPNTFYLQKQSSQGCSSRVKRGLLLLNLDPLPKEEGQQEKNETNQNENNQWKAGRNIIFQKAVYNMANFKFSQEKFNSS